MRLKVSPKTAIQKIDTLVKEGANMIAWYSDTYDEVSEAADVERKRKRDERERKIEAIRNEPSTIDVQTPYGITMAVPNTRKLMEIPRLQLEGYSFFDEPTEAGRKGMKQLHGKFIDWRDRTEAALQEIFMDFTPVYSFRNAYGDYYGQVTLDAAFKEYMNTMREIQAKTNTLIGFYNMLVANIRSPLFYLPERTTICFYDFVCPLKADTNEAALCQFMFDHSIGEKVEMLDIYNHMMGEQNDALNADQRRIIANAYDGVNRKTRDAFGFPVLAKDKVTISLTLPARITTNIT